MKRNVYLKMKSLAEARAIFESAFDWSGLMGVETVATADALGRVTARPVLASVSSPSYHGAAMDGYAVRADQYLWRVGGASDPAHHRSGGLPGEHRAAHAGGNERGHHDRARPGAGRRPDRDLCAAAFPWQHVRRVGEDIVAGELILPHHHRLSATDLAALLTGGVFRLEVRTRPRVAILATGSELVDWQEAERTPPTPGAIIESNSVLLAGLVREAGGEPIVLERQPDELDAVRQAIDRAVDDDVAMVLVNAGASAGSKDFTSHAVEALGEVLVHGVKAMPGKPTLLGSGAWKARCRHPGISGLGLGVLRPVCSAGPREPSGLDTDGPG